MVKLALLSILCISFVVIVIDGKKMPSWHRPKWQCDQMNGFFEDEDDCTKFYFCQNYDWAHRGCPDGLHFNKESGRCESPEKAGCDKSYTTSTQTP